jgi:hypothetical protein
MTTLPLSVIILQLSTLLDATFDIPKAWRVQVLEHHCALHLAERPRRRTATAARCA